MMFDTHCHLNFKAFEKTLPDVLDRAKSGGVNYFVVPGTDIETSKKAVEIAEKYENVYAAVGIHPHHAMSLRVEEIEKLLLHPKVIAVGEVGIDRHNYKQTKYLEYQITEEFIELQKELLREQIKLAIKYKKSLILHNRQGVGVGRDRPFLDVVDQSWDESLSGRTVFHCCEPDFVEMGHAPSLLKYAIDHHIYIGVDGDVTYENKSFDFAQDKQEFVKKIPLELLVLETDSPYLLPEPLKSKKLYPNEPKNIPLIAEFISQLKGVSQKEIIEVTTINAKKLFQIK